MTTLPHGPFAVILADPPWRFASNSDAKPGRNARRHYPTMPTAEIAAMPVAQIAACDAALLLWATAPMLPDALIVMRAWGFRYVSNVIWVKPRIGTGFWARNRHEMLLIGRRGAVPCPRPLFRDSVIAAPTGAHSVKPAFAHEAAERGWPGSARIELFARRPRAGWTVWGNEVEAAA